MGKLWEPGPRYSQTWVQRHRHVDHKPWENYKAGRLVRKLLWQTVASVLIFFLVIGVFQLQSPWAGRVKTVVRGWFTEDYDIETVLKFFTAVGLWGDTFERAAMEASSQGVEQLMVPVSGQITRPYGWVVNSDQSRIFSDGIIIAAPENTPVKAAMSGKVSRIANHEELGRIIEISNEQGYTITYGHCKEILVNLDDEITAGQVIARVGKTGNAPTAQLYLRIVKDKKTLDPAKLFLTTANQT